MAWEPTHAATDVRRVVGNLVTFFEANQSDALAWAYPNGPLDPLAWYRTAEVRMRKDFPHAGVVRRRVTTEDADDGLRIRYELTLEIEVTADFKKGETSDRLAELQGEVDNYCYAVESMVLNIPDSTLLEDVTGAGSLRKTVTSSDPLEVAVSDTKALFNAQMTVVLEFREIPYGNQ